MRLLTGLRAFHYTATHNGTTAAAAAMQVSQPTVSAQVKGLEREFGVQLFNQIGRRLVLTEFGESLLRIAAVGPFNVMKMLSVFRMHHPDLFVTVSVGDSAEIVDRIQNYHADVGLLVHAVQSEGIESIPFRRQPLVVFVHRDHPLAGRPALRMADLQDHKRVIREPGSTTRRVFDDALARAGVTVNTVMEIGSREAIREAVANGIGFGVVSDIAYVPDERLCILPITDLDAATHSHVIYRRERLRSRVVTAFLKLVEELRGSQVRETATSS